MRGAVRTVAVVAGELLMALGLVAVFFIGFLAIYSVSFPAGTRIIDAVGVENRRDAHQRRAVASGDGEPVEAVPFVALLTDVRRRVKDKPGDAIVWGSSDSGTELGERHAVQSFADSGATIRFDDENRLELGENTMIVIRDMHRTGRRARRVASIVVLGGELRGQVGHAAGDTPLVQITSTANASLRVDAADADSGGTTEFRISTGADDSATFSVIGGRAQLTTPLRTIELSSEQSATVGPGGEIQVVEPLPDPPVLETPEDGRIFPLRTAPPRIDFRWAAPAERIVYRLELARDAGFRDIVYWTVLTDPRFRHGNLGPGRYYWRVRTMRNTTEGPPSGTRSFEVRRDEQPPPLEVVFPDGVLERASLTLGGTTEAGAELFIDGRPIPVAADGSFTHELTLEPGLNVVVVEAIDPAGNTTYRSSLIQVRSPTRENVP